MSERVASSTMHFCDICHGSVPKAARCLRALGSVTGLRALGSWPTPVPSSSHPRRTRGEVRGRSRKAQVLTHDGDESCRPLQVRPRERHSVYRRVVRPYQQVQCVPSISTSPPLRKLGDFLSASGARLPRAGSGARRGPPSVSGSRPL